jgi:DNA-3-methyladenine glycosylase I
MKKRCKWVNIQNELYLHYHDTQWGVPVHDDILLFEMLILEGAQAGLSWETVLKKRDNYRKAFKGFDPQKVAKFTDKYVEELLQNEGIIRNRLKIKSAVANANAFLKIQKEFGSFDLYLWKFVNYIPINHQFETFDTMPTKDEISDRISKDLKKRGMSFIGSTIIYAFMQAIGMINAHTTDCFRYNELI